MSVESTWFDRIQNKTLLTPKIRQEWATDLLAVGPHGPWVEPDLWQEAMAKEWILSTAEPVYRAANRVMTSSALVEVLWSARYLMGFVEQPLVSDVRGEQQRAYRDWEAWVECHSECLPYLWVRSAAAIRDNILACNRLAIQSIIYRFEEEDAEAVDEVIATALSGEIPENGYLRDYYDRWNASAPTEMSSNREYLFTALEVADILLFEEVMDALRALLATRFYDQVRTAATRAL